MEKAEVEVGVSKVTNPIIPILMPDGKLIIFDDFCFGKKSNYPFSERRFAAKLEPYPPLFYIYGNKKLGPKSN